MDDEVIFSDSALARYLAELDEPINVPTVECASFLDQDQLEESLGKSNSTSSALPKRASKIEKHNNLQLWVTVVRFLLSISFPLLNAVVFNDDCLFQSYLMTRLFCVSFRRDLLDLSRAYRSQTQSNHKNGECFQWKEVAASLWALTNSSGISSTSDQDQDEGGRRISPHLLIKEVQALETHLYLNCSRLIKGSLLLNIAITIYLMLDVYFNMLRVLSSPSSSSSSSWSFSSCFSTFLSLLVIILALLAGLNTYHVYLRYALFEQWVGVGFKVDMLGTCLHKISWIKKKVIRRVREVHVVSRGYLVRPRMSAIKESQDLGNYKNMRSDSNNHHIGTCTSHYPILSPSLADLRQDLEQLLRRSIEQLVQVNAKVSMLNDLVSSSIISPSSHSLHVDMSVEENGDDLDGSDTDRSSGETRGDQKRRTSNNTGIQAARNQCQLCRNVNTSFQLQPTLLGNWYNKDEQSSSSSSFASSSSSSTSSSSPSLSELAVLSEQFDLMFDQVFSSFAQLFSHIFTSSSSSAAAAASSSCSFSYSWLVHSSLQSIRALYPNNARQQQQQRQYEQETDYKLGLESCEARDHTRETHIDSFSHRKASHCDQHQLHHHHPHSAMCLCAVGTLLNQALGSFPLNLLAQCKQLQTRLELDTQSFASPTTSSSSTSTSTSTSTTTTGSSSSSNLSRRLVSLNTMLLEIHHAFTSGSARVALFQDRTQKILQQRNTLIQKYQQVNLDNTHKKKDGDDNKQDDKENDSKNNTKDDEDDDNETFESISRHHQLELEQIIFKLVTEDLTYLETLLDGVNKVRRHCVVVNQDYLEQVATQLTELKASANYCNRNDSTEYSRSEDAFDHKDNDNNTFQKDHNDDEGNTGGKGSSSAFADSLMAELAKRRRLQKEGGHIGVVFKSERGPDTSSDVEQTRRRRRQRQEENESKQKKKQVEPITFMQRYNLISEMKSVLNHRKNEQENTSFLIVEAQDHTVSK